MKVLITGGTGFTGGHLCERLVKEGHHVRTIARKPEKSPHLPKLGVEVIPGDIINFDTVIKATKDVDTVYHIAALYRQEGVPRQTFWDVNVTGTENLLKASSLNGVRRFIHCSTVGVHGDIDHPPANEDTPYRPGDHYQETKMEGEKAAINYMQKGEMAVTVFRPGAIYGPGDLRFLKLFKAIHKGRFWMIGSGDNYYHLIYIDDLIDGILLCGSKKEAIGGIYILAGKEYVTIKVLVSLIAGALGVSLSKWRIPFWPVYFLGYFCELIFRPLGLEPPLYRRRIDFFRKSRAFDISKAKEELGFRPKIDLKEGIFRVVSWYRENGYL